MGRSNHGTSGGVPLTDARIRELAEEAELGYDATRLRTRTGRGRPPLGSEAAGVFQVRLPPALRQALEHAAHTHGTTPSDIVRRALVLFLEHDAQPLAAKGHIHTVPDPDGKGWKVIREGQDRAVARAGTQAEADKKGRDRARKDKVEYTLHGRDGRVRKKDSYGNDPRRGGGRKSGALRT